MGGFPKYGSKQLGKVNAMRRANTQPDFMGIPIIHDADVLYVKASEIGNKPASCYTCIFKNSKAGTCRLIGPSVLVQKFIKEGIEYWPCCGKHTYGTPNKEEAEYCTGENPSGLGLIWINAPYTAADYGGANCGGRSGGDDCDHYMTESDNKREVPKAFCRVLRHEVANGDVCCAWRDDDELDWEKAQNILQGPQDQRDRKRLAEEIIGRD